MSKPDPIVDTFTFSNLIAFIRQHIQPIVGIIFLLASILILTSNSGRAIDKYKTLHEARKIVIAIDPYVVNPNNEGKLVYLSGAIMTEETLIDPTFHVSINAVRLVRDVQMYQWTETIRIISHDWGWSAAKKQTTIYNYDHVWSNTAINSDNFMDKKHLNLTAISKWKYRSLSLIAKDLRLGAFRIGAQQLDKIATPKLLTSGKIKLPSSLRNKLIVQPDGYFIGKDPAEPQAGDIKISFKYAPALINVSIIAKQVKDSFEPYVTASGEINFCEDGIYSAEEIFQKYQDTEHAATWAIRVSGLVLMIIGMSLVLKHFLLFAVKIVPFFDNFAAMGHFSFVVILSVIVSAIIVEAPLLLYHYIFTLFGLALLLAILVISLLRSKAQPRS